MHPEVFSRARFRDFEEVNRGGKVMFCSLEISECAQWLARDVRNATKKKMFLFRGRCILIIQSCTSPDIKLLGEETCEGACEDNEKQHMLSDISDVVGEKLHSYLGG